MNNKKYCTSLKDKKQQRGNKRRENGYDAKVLWNLSNMSKKLGSSHRKYKLKHFNTTYGRK